MKKILVITVIAAAIGFAVWWIGRDDIQHAPARIEWKDQARQDLNAIDVTSEAPDFDDLHEEWFSSHGIVMIDGSWIAFRSRCHKEDPRIEDIFIGRASNGKWYYSTYHFCIGACVLPMDEQPESLSTFIEQYAMVEFDGESDDCLLTTWPPEE